VVCTHLHDIAKVCAIDDAYIIKNALFIKNALVDSIFNSTHYAYTWFLLFAFIHAFEVMQLSCVHLALL
jgi:Ni,Fe-hydrogenase I large subunit